MENLSEIEEVIGEMEVEMNAPLTLEIDTKNLTVETILQAVVTKAMNLLTLSVGSAVREFLQLITHVASQVRIVPLTILRRLETELKAVQEFAHKAFEVALKSEVPVLVPLILSLGHKSLIVMQRIPQLLTIVMTSIGVIVKLSSRLA
jgi:hypothetical protein